MFRGFLKILYRHPPHFSIFGASKIKSFLVFLWSRTRNPGYKPWKSVIFFQFLLWKCAVCSFDIYNLYFLVFYIRFVLSMLQTLKSSSRKKKNTVIHRIFLGTTVTPRIILCQFSNIIVVIPLIIFNFWNTVINRIILRSQKDFFQIPSSNAFFFCTYSERASFNLREDTRLSQLLRNSKQFNVGSQSLLY